MGLSTNICHLHAILCIELKILSIKFKTFNVYLLKFANYIINLDMATDLKTYWSIYDRLKISEGKEDTGPPGTPFLPKSTLLFL